jgi:hypothetical protein
VTVNGRAPDGLAEIGGDERVSIALAP